MSMIAVTFDDGRRIRCKAGTPVDALLKDRTDAHGFPYIGCLVNNEVSSLSYPLDVDSTVRFLTMATPLGMRVYRNSLTFLLAKAVADLFPRARFSVEHSLGTGYYCTFENGLSTRVGAREVRQIETRLRALVARAIPIERHKLAFADALALFEKAGQADKVNLLRFRNPPKIVTYVCDGFADLAQGPLAPHTGVLAHFKLIPYPPGLVLQFPDRENTRRVPPFRDQPHLFQIFREHKEWGRILGVHNVGRLNEIIVNGDIRDFIKIEEAFHEKKIAKLADQIFARRRHVRVVLISGPSAAGKTTFAKRLAVQLQVSGLKPVTISLDNYYVDDELTPRGPDDRPDYEHIDAVDVKLFNTHLVRLVDGKEVELPYFNFQAKHREFRGQKLRLAPDQILLVEGIHGLNPRFTPAIPARSKFKVYISALTQLNIDANNRISTTDNRLMRRLFRDYQYRHNSALTTLRMWSSVRRGEKTWIFPFQQYADAAFNSALDYELAVLKPLVEPLLMEVKPAEPEYAEARRLQAFLSNFLAVSRNDVPHTSILREFIGASSFKY